MNNIILTHFSQLSTMDNMAFTPQIVLIAILFIWVAILTFLFVRFYFYYDRLARGTKKESMAKLIEDVLRREEKLKTQMDENVEAIKFLSMLNKKNIQKVGVHRFNPFKDTGGDQSFILTFLDGNDTGVLISGLHTRTGTRWYTKHIVKGKGSDYDLSKDEEEALQGATAMH